MNLIPLRYIFEFLAMLVVLFYWSFNFVVIYHLARFGVGLQPKKMAALFLFGSVVMFLACTVFFLNLDFNRYEIYILDIYKLR